LKEKLHQCNFCALAIDESTDHIDTAQSKIFVPGVDDHFNVFEELLPLSSLKEQTRFINILVEGFLEEKQIKIGTICGNSNAHSHIRDRQQLRLNRTFKKRARGRHHNY